ncbi:MAG TPA: hypothetical protein VF153_03035 [Candidatus Limnocylindria bacterium]
MTAHQPRGLLGGRAALAAAAGAVLAGSVLLGLRAPVVAAPPNQLLNPSVSPLGGNTGTTFAFAVTFESGQGNTPTSVTAVAGNVVIPLTRISGTPSNGRYRGTAKLPAGNWAVIFQATAKGNDPNVGGPSLSVNATPTPKPTPKPTPRPTPKPTPKPTPRPTHANPTQAPPPSPPHSNAPASAKPGRPSQKPRATPSATASARASAVVGGDVQTPTPTPTPTASPTAKLAAGRSAVGTSPLITVVVGSLVAIGVLALAVMSIVLAAGRRRRRDNRLELRPEEALQGGGVIPGAAIRAAGPRQPTLWERDWALDQAPIGSVEYQPPTDEPAPDGESA